MSHAPVGSDPPVRLSGEQGASPFSLPGVTPGQNDAAGGIGLGGGVRYCVCIKDVSASSFTHVLQIVQFGLSEGCV